LVLGVPIWLGYRILGYGTWLIPTIFMAFFASVGPSIYLYLQKRAEDKILQEQRRYQATLRKAATGMGRVKQLKKLLNLVVYVVTRAVHLENTLIYLRDERRKQYVLCAFKSRKQSESYLDAVSFDSELVIKLSAQHSPINLEELYKRVESRKTVSVEEMTTVTIKGELALPIHIEDKLLAFIVLGRKESGKDFTEEDLTVFSSLTNQIALAIENAQFYEESKTSSGKIIPSRKDGNNWNDG
jgi:GAF domain-containing protein